MDANGKIQTIAGPSDDGSYSINGAGYAPDGRLVVTVSTVVTEMVPEFGYDDEGNPKGQLQPRETTVVKPIYLTDIHGEPPADGTQELEIYNTVTQNADMGPILQFQRAQRSHSLSSMIWLSRTLTQVLGLGFTEGTDNETMDRNVNIGATIMEGLPEDVQQEVRQVQDRVLRETDREQVILPRVEDGEVIFFDKQGRRRTDLDPIPLASAGAAERPEDMTPAPSRANQSNQEDRQLVQSNIQAEDLPEMEEPTRQEYKDARKPDETRIEGRQAGPIPNGTEGRTIQGEARDFEVIPTTEEELESRQAEGVIRNQSERQLQVAEANLPAAEAIINSEAETPTPEAEFLVSNELQNAPEEITTEDLEDMTPVGLALTLLGTNEREGAEVIQGMMDRWVGEGQLDVTTGSGAWCAAFVSSVLADSGYAEVPGSC